MINLFHIGYPKCGSSSLQRHVFEGLSAVNYVEEKGLWLNEIRFSTCDPDKIAKNIRHKNMQLSVSSSKVNVFSHEDMLFSGAESAVVLQHLACVVPDAHILLVVRPQVEIIRSLYDMKPNLELSGDAGASMVSVNEFVNEIFERGTPFAADRFMFGRWVDLAVQLFGKERVHVFSFSGLFRSGEQIGRLASLLQAEEGAVRAALAKPAVNEFNLHVTRRSMRRLMGPVRASWLVPQPVLAAINRRIARYLPATRTELPHDVVQRIKAYYAEDNARLAELVPEIEPLS